MSASKQHFAASLTAATILLPLLLGGSHVADASVAPTPTPAPNAGGGEIDASPLTFQAVPWSIDKIDFKKYWIQNGALERQGYPISGVMQEKSDEDGKIYATQYFERAVFEEHPENAAPYDVLLRRLGAMELQKEHPAGVKNDTPDKKDAYEDPVTHDLIGDTNGFKSYYETNGGISQFGRPLTNVLSEKSKIDEKEYKMQYFERAIFEEHPENKPPYNVELTLLGAQNRDSKYIVDPKSNELKLKPQVTPTPQATATAKETATSKPTNTPEATKTPVPEQHGKLYDHPIPGVAHFAGFEADLNNGQAEPIINPQKLGMTFLKAIDRQFNKDNANAQDLIDSQINGGGQGNITINSFKANGQYFNIPGSTLRISFLDKVDNVHLNLNQPIGIYTDLDVNDPTAVLLDGVATKIEIDTNGKMNIRLEKKDVEWNKNNLQIELQRLLSMLGEINEVPFPENPNDPFAGLIVHEIRIGTSVIKGEDLTNIFP